MDWITWVVYYLVIGAIFTFIIDVISVLYETRDNLNNVERVWVILFWPLSLTLFIYSIIISFKNKNN